MSPPAVGSGHTCSVCTVVLTFDSVLFLSVSGFVQSIYWMLLRILAQLDMNPEDEAKRLFDNGFNCAESVLLATSHEKFAQSIGGIIPRIATGFGGGIARNGDVCGALTGGVMAIGLALGRVSPEDSAIHVT